MVNSRSEFFELANHKDKAHTKHLEDCQNFQSMEFFYMQNKTKDTIQLMKMQADDPDTRIGR